MLIAIWPLIIALVGILMYFIASNPKVVEVGRLTYFAGLLGTVFTLLRHTLRLG